MMTEWSGGNGLRRAVLVTSIVLALLSGSPAWAVVTFTMDTLIDDGDTTYDDEDIVVDGCTVTINGAHTFSSLSIINNGIVTHSAGISGFHLTITSDLTVDADASITVDENGYGFTAGPGAGGSTFVSGHVGAGGGGYGGHGGDGDPASGGAVYGSVTEPIDLGSGGGRANNAYGGAGGGAVRLTVGGTLTLEGSLTANGEDGRGNSCWIYGCDGGGGAGGSVYLTTGVLAGTGLISANGGNGAVSRGGGGAGGRIALYSVTNSFTGTVSACGGSGNQYGGAGTIYEKSPSQTWGDLSIGNCGNSGAKTTLPIDTLVFDAVEVIDKGKLEIPAGVVLTQGLDILTVANEGEMIIAGALVGGGGSGFATAEITSGGNLALMGATALTCPIVTVSSLGTLTISESAQLTCTDLQVTSDGDLAISDAGQLTGLDVQVSSQGVVTVGGTGGLAADNIEVLDDGTLVLDKAETFATLYVASGGTLTHTIGITGFDLTILGDLTIDAGGSVSADGRGYGPSEGPGAGGSSTYSGGGGGYGGAGGDTPHTTGGSTYGSISESVDLGSGGGNISGASGGRGGGTLRLTVVGTLLINGSVTANGTDGGVYSGRNGGGGAGGSVYVSVGTLTGTGQVAANGGSADDGGGGGGGGRIVLYYDTDSFTGTISSCGGPGVEYGGAGTIYSKLTGQTWPDLLVDNCGNPGANTTLVTGSYTFDMVEVLNKGKLEIPDDVALTMGSDVLAISNEAEMILAGELNGGGGGGFTAVEVTTGGGLTLLGTAELSCSPVTVSSQGTLSISEASQLVCTDIDVASGGALTLTDAALLACTDLVVSSQALMTVGGTGELNAEGVEILDGGTLVLDSVETIGAMHIATGGVLTYTAGVAGLDLTVLGDLTVDAGGVVSANGKGYGPQSGPGAGGGSYNGGGGGGYGGAGGTYGDGSGGSPYGSPTEPVDLGSGGGGAYGSSGGTGGGALRLTVNGTLLVDGSVTANGTDGELHWSGYYAGGGGSGGSIYVTAGVLAGEGQFVSAGGSGGGGMAGGGGGGRIAIYCHRDMSLGTERIAVEGGTGYANGESGTIFLSLPLYIVSHSPHFFEGSVDHINVLFSEEVDPSTFTSVDIEIAGPEGLIQADPPTRAPGHGENTWRIAFPPQSTSGEYHVFVGPHIEDVVVGHEMNQDWDEITGEDPDDIYDAAFATVDVEVLTLGDELLGSFDASGALRFYRIDVAVGKDLEIQIDDLDDAGVNELYASFARIPTLSDFEYRGPTQPMADQVMRIPGTQAGSYYILSYASDVPDPAPSEFTIVADYLPLSITNINPAQAWNAETMAPISTINGAGFDLGATVVLRRDLQTDIPGEDVTWIDPATIFARFNMLGAEAGLWEVVVTNPDSSEVSHPLTVLEGGLPNLETNMVLPGRVGYHATATIYVEYANVGDTSMRAPLLVLTASQEGRQAALLTLDSNRLVSGFWTSAIPEGFANSVQFIASGATPGLLQPGESGRAVVYYAGWQLPWDTSYPPINWHLGILNPDDPTVVDWAALKADMRPPYVRQDAWDTLWSNFTSQVGSTWGDYVSSLSENAVYLSELGQQVEGIGKLLAFEFLQADGLNPLRTLAGAVDAAVEAPGLPLVFSRSFAGTVSQRFELGALGRGWSHNWEYALSEASDGTVTIAGPGGARRTFQPDSRNSSHYFAQPGDHATLTPLGGGVFSLQEPAGLLRLFRADGTLDYLLDPNGNQIVCDYSGDSLTSLTHSSGQSLQLVYNPAGRLESITDHLNRETTFTYDGADDHLLIAQYYNGRTTTYDYDLSAGASQHALTEVTSSCCGTRYFDYDAQGRLEGTHLEGTAEAVSFAYGTAGNVTATDALATTSEFYFDHRGLLVKTEDALGNAVKMAYDDDYNLVRLTDPAGHFHEYTYDRGGHLTESTDPLGHTSLFTYQAAFNRLTSVTDANENVTRYTYTGAGNLESITYADDSHEDWTYEPPALGNPTTWTNRRGHAASYTYNADGRLTTKTFADGSLTEYVYNPRGNLTEARTLDPSLLTLEESVMSYDANDRLTNITFTGGKWLSFTYDPAGRRLTSEDQLGHILTYSYDVAGRLEGMTDELDELVVSYEYDPVGRLASKTLGNEMVATYTYDAAGQLLTLTNELADETPISWFNYTYDSRGRSSEMVTHYGTWTYEYDDLSQLTHAALASTDPLIPDQDLTYVYDALGNRIRTIENGVTTEYTTNNLNHYLTVSNTSYLFDLDGNLIEQADPNGTTFYTYNSENRLIGVARAADTWGYTYDALGNRVAVDENSVVTRYVVDPIGLGNVVGEYDNLGSLVAHYDHGSGLLSMVDSGGAEGFYSFDALGNTSELTGVSGLELGRYTYEPFGGPMSQIGSAEHPFLFVGEYGVMRDNTGFDFMRARHYVPSIGRFATQDPLGLGGQQMNLQGYCGNAPTMFLDPGGMQFFPNRLPTAPELSATIGPAFRYVISQGSSAINSAVIKHPSTVALIQNARTVLFNFRFSAFPVDTPVRFVAVAIPAGLVAIAQPVFLAAVYTTATIGAYSILDSFGNSVGNWAYDVMPPSRFSDMMDWLVGSIWPVAAVDPNEKTGPSGYGPLSFVAQGNILSYMVEFENDSTATAPAQIVTVSDALGANFDWTTFELTGIGFGDNYIAVPPDSQYFATTAPMTYNDVDFEVQIEVGINTDTGEVYAAFYSVDPETGLPPSVDIGFLPPEDGTGRGMGHISFVVEANPGLATGTEIRNVAIIQFDGGEIIATNQVDPHDPSQGTDPDKEALVTIDSGGPTSSVLGLPPMTQRYPITIEWDGQDDIGGSGIGTYDVYVSADGGPFGLWQHETAETDAGLSGQPGSTYEFYAVATDNVGNMEEMPAEAEAVTWVLPFAPEAASQSPRYLSAAVNTDNPTMPHAIRVVGLGGCVDAFVSETGQLGGTPVCLTVDEWSTVYVADSDIVPDTGYDVYAAIGCPDNLVFSSPTAAVTPIWGDLNSDDAVNGHDLFVFIEAYLEHLPYWAGDLCAGGATPETPDGQVDGDDLLCWIDAYYGETYPFADCGGRAGRGNYSETVPPVSTEARLTIVPRTLHARPGRTVFADVFLEGAQDLRLYQVTIDVRGGTTGELRLRDVSVDTTRKDHVFSGQPPVSIPDAQMQRVVSALWEGGVSAPDRHYLATFEFVPTRDARGIFRLELRGDPDTMLRDSQRRPIAFSGSAEATIRVGGSSLSPKPTRERTIRGRTP